MPPPDLTQIRLQRRTAEGPAGTARIYSATTIRALAALGAGVVSEAAMTQTASARPHNDNAFVIDPSRLAGQF